MDGLNIGNASIGIDERGLEAYRDAIRTSILHNVSQGIVNKFSTEIAPQIRAAWGGNEEGARDRFITQMNTDMQTLQQNINSLEYEVNKAFSEAIKKFVQFEQSVSYGRRF